MSSKTKPAFPGRTGMGYENGLSKLEYITVQLLTKYDFRDNTEIQISNIVRDAITLSKQIISSCEAVEKAGQ